MKINLPQSSNNTALFTSIFLLITNDILCSFLSFYTTNSQQKMINVKFVQIVLNNQMKIYLHSILFQFFILINPMQELKVESLNTSFHCIENNLAQHFCFNPQCQNSAIVCVRPHCKCMVGLHDDCGVISAQRLISKVLAKKTNLSKQLVIAFQKVDKIYIEMIQKLSEEREELELIKDNYGLSFRQATFLQLIKNSDIEHITGKLISQIKANVHQTNEIGEVTQQNIEQYWQNFDKQFKDLIYKLKAVYTDKQTVKPIKFLWSSYSEKEGYTIENMLLKKTGNHFRTNAAITEPTMSFSKKNMIGFRINKITNNISIGIAQQNFYKKQQSNNLGGLRQNKMYAMSMQGGLINLGQSRGNLGFTFNVGDTIFMMYDPHLNQLKLSKNEKDGFFIFKNIQKSDGFCFIATGLAISDQIEIVDQIPQIDWNRTHYVPKPTTNSVPLPGSRNSSLFFAPPPPPLPPFPNPSQSLFGQTNVRLEQTD